MHYVTLILLNNCMQVHAQLLSSYCFGTNTSEFEEVDVHVTAVVYCQINC